MSDLDTMSLRERAEQLRNPSGPPGLAVAERLAPINREGNMRAVADLALERCDRVLEVGCGLGDMAAVVIAGAEDVEYCGLDASETMIDAARDRAPKSLPEGGATFHLAEAERMPFEAGSFTKVFSVGVIHFWRDPVLALAETARVMLPGARMVMACLGPDRAPAFAREEYGFHLHSADQWMSFCQRAGLSSVEVRESSLGSVDGPQTLWVSARR